MIKYKWVWKADDDFSMQYEIPAGEGIPEHAHTGDREDHLHDVTVISGEVYVKTVGANYVAGPGDRVEFDGTKPHTVTAIKDSITLHKFLNGIPAYYKDLPESEHSG